ncbi:MAG: TIGR00730 family Rossman fold protein [Hamadaea sp.]|uniref:LOG family protein n=1 Tax=Hamadaea sp. TaxID=2024425 RepID=UPI001853925A|nr:TIGR00730 family Rossman fold protein [Hamadaea sp.]NUT24317.1 TIGR00730 family Rossman fold protein [Hamadaea sp.]
MAAICVFCSGKSDAPESFFELARQTGKGLAREGHSLVYGGGGLGMMGALAQAAHAAGVPVTGVMPEGLVALERASHEVDELIVSADLASRKATMIEKADAFLILPGGLGTLDELFEVWTTGPQLRLHDKPVVLLDADGFYSGLVTWLASCPLISPVLAGSITVAESLDEAWEALR